MANQKRLIQINKIFLESLTELSEFVETKLDSASLSQVKLRLSDLITNYNTFNQNQLELESLDEKHLESDIRSVVTRHYYNLRPALEERLEELKIKKGTGPTIQPDTLAFVPKLPEITLDNFSGEITKWKGFIESFDNHVHNNPKLNDLTKFQYLKHSVKGIAAKSFESLDFVAANYVEARRLLFERFDKPHQIAEEHIKSLFSIRPIDIATSIKLLNLVDEFNSHIRSLKTLGRPVQYWDDLLIHMMCSKFDSDTKAKWRDEAPRNVLPTFKDICEFLQVQSSKLDQGKSDPMLVRSSHSTKSTMPKPVVRNNSQRQATSFTASKAYHCELCNKSGHSVMRCYQFLSMSANDRKKRADLLKLCTNCLRSSHTLSECNIRESCRICNTRHHTLLHSESVPATESFAKTSQPIQSKTNSFQGNNSNNSLLVDNSACLSHGYQPKFVFLATALVYVMDIHGSKVMVRALLDSGSQLNFITGSLAKRLGLQSTTTHINISGIGGTPTNSSRCTMVNFQSRTSQFNTVIEAHILKRISAYQPPMQLDSLNWSIPANIKLADPQFFESRPIDILLGADIFGELQAVGQVKLGTGLPLLQHTVLGWVVLGSTTVTTQRYCNISINESNSQQLDKLLEKLWQFDDCETTNINSLQGNECEHHFKETSSRNSLGQFVVRLPFSRDPSLLGDSSSCARKRFLNLESKLDRNVELRSAYNQFMVEYEQLSHMELVTDIERSHFYLPHHCVVKPDSSSTKLRVVFDGSARTSSGYSLNDILMTGPVVQNELFSILIRFRSHKYAFSADICKMYRQILLHADDQQYHYVYWRHKSADELRTFKLKTVTYGTTTAPFLATRCLLQLALDNQSTDPVTSAVIQNDIYVDDLLSGSNCIVEAARLKSSISHILTSAGMRLRKWCSNETSLLADIPVEDCESMLHINDDSCVKTLGLYWQPLLDHLNIQVPIKLSDLKRITKRTVISQLASIFDPNGLVAPVILLGKIFLQKLWSLNIHWDESLPLIQHSYWANFIANLHDLNRLDIPRHTFNGCHLPQDIQLHGFADASEKAYGAAVYVRYRDIDTYVIRLLCAKSRVAPLKPLTLPRLELCATLLLVKLVEKVANVVNFDVKAYFYWTDSLITLHWINSPPTKWKPYVANRVAMIQSLSKSKNWLHIESKLNPADLVSRGVTPHLLISSDLWWRGPPFLRLADEQWNNERIIFGQSIYIPEERTKRDPVSLLAEYGDDPLDRIHAKYSYTMVCNSMGYVARFIHNARKLSIRTTGNLTLEEIDKALSWILRSVQLRAFKEIHHGLQKKDYTIRDPSLKALSIFMDEKGILRVGGRLQFASLSYESRHAVLLPKDHFFTLAMMTHCHKKHLHVGPQGLLAAVRQTYWPINGKQLAKKVCRECVLCTRARPRLLQQKMAELPAERVNISPPFFNVAVDYAGPLYIHYHIRGRVPTKSYLVVFVCLATKAVHLELASDLSTAAFLGALRRIIASRGLCKTIYSDNGTNFVGANSRLHDLYKLLKSNTAERARFCQENKIEWKFTPPQSPHFGGLHEAAVKSAKYHIRRMMGNLILSYEELGTLIKQVEAVLNSRPLTSISTDDNVEILTPGHFLIGRPLTSIPDPALQETTNLSYAKRWQLADQVYRQFWTRWSKEYLQQLQHRFKWQTPTKNIPLGTIVTIKDENLPPLKWKFGRIIEQHPGSDGLVRVVSVKTATGIFKRAVTKLCPLPVDVEHPNVQGGEHINTPKKS